MTDARHGAHCTTQDSEGGNTPSKGTLKSKDVKELKKIWEHFSKKTLNSRTVSPSEDGEPMPFD